MAGGEEARRGPRWHARGHEAGADEVEAATRVEKAVLTSHRARRAVPVRARHDLPGCAVPLDELAFQAQSDPPSVLCQLGLPRVRLCHTKTVLDRPALELIQKSTARLESTGELVWLVWLFIKQFLGNCAVLESI